MNNQTNQSFHKSLLLPVGIIVVSIIVAVFIFNQTPLRSEQNQEPASQNAAEQSLATQTVKAGAISISVTPLDISSQSDKWKFEIVLDTHTAELDADLTLVAALKDEKGAEYKPLLWEGDPPGGHHRKGTLTFQAINPPPQSITFSIKEIGDQESTFSWQL